METVETWLFDLLMFAQGKAQPDVSDDVNRFYSPPQPPPPQPSPTSKELELSPHFKNCTERKKVRLIAGYFTYEVPTPLPGATAVNGFKKTECSPNLH